MCMPSVWKCNLLLVVHWSTDLPILESFGPLGLGVALFINSSVIIIISDRGNRSSTYLGQQMSIPRIYSDDMRELKLSWDPVPFVSSRAEKSLLCFMADLGHSVSWKFNFSCFISLYFSMAQVSATAIPSIICCWCHYLSMFFLLHYIL